MFYISPQMLTVISGVLSACAGILWFVRARHGGEVDKIYKQEEILSDA
jgi:hypothetical protein